MNTQYYTEICDKMVGKTIDRIDDSCVNVLRFYFTDGTDIEIYAECGSGPSSIPFFYVGESNS